MVPFRLDFVGLLGCAIAMIVGFLTTDPMVVGLNIARSHRYSLAFFATGWYSISRFYHLVAVAQRSVDTGKFIPGGWNLQYGFQSTLRIANDGVDGLSESLEHGILSWV